MIRIICPDCKNAYLQKTEAELTCPGCNAAFPEGEENFLSGAQYYHEGDYASAGDCLMKYIVKNGAEPRAIFYKALCDAQGFDEDTSSLKDLYVKVLEALMDISDDDFVRYLAMANDEVLKIEKAVTQLHLELFADADAEKIKKEVSAIIKFQDEAKIYRNKLNEFANSYNERAVNKISVKLSSCFFVDPLVATEVGAKKYEKIVESINSHTVFTGILSNEIKNLEIYYRCIVMFFEKNRRKYEFLMSSAEKFSQIAKLLEDGRYASIKGVPTICEKLKAAGYDFFQESLRDHDDEFEQQTETVVVLVAETVEVPVETVEEATQEVQEATPEATEFEDVYSSTVEETAEAEEAPEVEDVAEATETEAAEEAEAEDDAVVEIDETVEDVETVEEATEAEEASEADEETVVEPAEETEPEEAAEATEEVAEIAEEPAVTEDATEVEEFAEATEAEVTEEAEAEDDAVVEIAEAVEEAPQVEETAEVEEEKEEQTNLLKTIAENGNFIEDDNKNEPSESVEETPVVAEESVNEEAEAPKKRKHKKSVAPIIAVVVVIVAIIGLVALKVVPAKLNESNYEKAGILFNEKNYGEAAEIYLDLGDYEDSADKYLLARYNYAAALEEAKKFDEAKEIYIALGNYEDSAGKVNSCIYNSAILSLEQGKYDDAIAVFNTLDGYADSENMIDECNYQKALKLIEAKDYKNAVEMLNTLTNHPDSENKILEAKYAYVAENFDAENETTLSYLKDLAQAKYKDSGDLRNKLLGTGAVLGEGISTCINYSETDTTENLAEVDSSKAFYFHVTVTDETLYTKKLTLDYETSAGYGFPEKSFVLTQNENTYTLKYPSDPGANYSITFSVLSDDNTTLITQKVTLK